LAWQTFSTAWETYQRVRGSPYEGLVLGYIAGLIAMCTHALGANTFIIVRIMEPFWFLTAIMVVLSLARRNPAAAYGIQLSAIDGIRR
jgi:hypothetical protein